MTDRRPIDDETLIRLRHGGPERAAELGALADRDPSVPDRLAEWDRQDAALRALYGPVADEPVPRRHLDLLDRAAVRRGLSRQPWARAAAVAGLIALGGVGGWTAARLERPPEAGRLLAGEALRTNATYAAAAAHPVEMSAADPARLTRWLSSRLGHRIALPDLGRYGFRLLGGRVLPGANGAAAMMMYEDDIGRRVTLFVAREPDGTETDLRGIEHGKVNGFWWIEDGLGCALVGELPRDTLRALSVKAYGDLTKT